ncbi:MAG: hypothetical protein ACKOF9_04385 [Burkholderiales bacterium]
MKRATFTGDVEPKKFSVSATTVRTNYHCAAYGCPNAAAIDDHGEHQPGKCFHHWSASRADWDRITAQIRRDQSMRNHGMVPTKPSKFTLDARAMNANGGRRLGIRSLTTDEELTL